MSLSLPRMMTILFIAACPAASEPPSVFHDQLPDDSRLHVLHDVDHPVNFTPFADRAAWETRAKQLREQVLVSQGLWPLPPWTELHAAVHGDIDRDAYTIQKVFFASYPVHYVSGNLYLPKKSEGNSRRCSARTGIGRAADSLSGRMRR